MSCRSVFFAVILMHMKVRNLIKGESHCIVRNQQADHIIDNLILVPIIAASPKCSLPRNHDIIWLFGDLNYRLRGDKKDWALNNAFFSNQKAIMPRRSEVLEWIHDLNFSSLMGRDELAHLRAFKHSSLGSFEEGLIDLNFN
jgi:hypothetical protein